MVDFEILECPPIDQFGHDFWRDQRGRSLRITAQVGGKPKELMTLFSNATPTSSVYFRERPQDEMDFLDELYGEMLRRKEKMVALPDDFDFLVPDARDFGLVSLEPYPDLIDKLVAYEERLSAGSLRDVVHVLGAMRKLHRSTDEGERRRIVDDLLEWLDTLPETERHCLAGAIGGSVFQWYRDQPAINHLVYEVIQRQPESLFEFEDYRAYLIQEFNRPGFKEYVKQRGLADRDP